ncbi:integrase, partial [Arthrobacter sp. M4]|nr:integrase [Arthrobacter sp. M4]
AAELGKLNEIWELDRIFTNYLLPQQKLLSKQRRGAKVTKKHDAPATPHQRAIKHERVHKRPIIQMNSAFKKIRPGALSRQILALTAELEALALAKKPATLKTVHRAWNN